MTVGGVTCHEVGGNTKPQPRDAGFPMGLTSELYMANHRGAPPPFLYPFRYASSRSFGFFLTEKIKYAIWQEEKCPETGRTHLQGYLELDEPKRMTGTKSLFDGVSVHLEPRKGTRDQARDYCSKEESRIGGPWEFGSIPTKKGERTDLKRAWESLKAGASDLDLFEELPQVAFKYQRGIQAARSVLARPRNPENKPEIFIWWGDSGTGKTRKAVEENPGAYILTKPNGNGVVWFDGYTGQDTIIFDEFYGWVPYDLLLRICDRYPLKLQVKGGFVECSATKFIFTSNKPWKEWYPNIDDHSALERRIKEFGTITHFVKL